MGIEYFKLPIFDRRPYCDPAEWAQRYRYMKTTASMFSFEQSPYFELPNQVMGDLAGTACVVLKVPSQTGKDLAWYTELPTPRGFVTMRDLRVGDELYSIDGSKTRVTFKTGAQFNRMYRVHFDDGTYLDAGEDHRWLAAQIDCNMKRGAEAVFTTREMFSAMESKRGKKSWFCRGKARSVFSIRVSEAVEGVDAELPIDPYVLGAWLGDGHSCCGIIYKSASDLAEMFPGEPILRFDSEVDSSKCPHVKPQGLTSSLRALNLIQNKHIPSMYLNASKSQRIELLRGLMDTDGAVSKGRVTWAQKSPRLTSDVCALLCSLGVKCHVRTMKKSIRSSGFVGEYLEIGFCTDLQVFRLERKRCKQTPTRRIDCHWRYIRRIEPIPTVESYCLQVDHPSHTFLAGRQYCVTHNTETLINMLGWIVEYDRANTLLIMDTKTSGIALSKNRIRPFLRDVCGLDYSKTASSKGKDNDHSMNAVDLGIGRGANVKIGSSRCAGDLCSTPVKYLLMDELDRWQQEIRGEGDPISLAFQRQLRFRGMTVMCSTPTLEDGRIYKYFKQGTCETWCAVCKCGAFMPCRWADIDWSEPSEPTIACRECGQVYTETDIKGLDHEYSPPANAEPFKDNFGRIWRSFEVFGTLCHSFYSWKSLRDYEIQALKTGEASYQSFVNTRLAEIYKPRDELSVELPALMRECRDDYSPYDLPVEVDFLCAGIDTHDNCLFVEVVGFSKDGREHWGVEYFVAPYDLQAQGGIRDCLEMLATKAYARVDGVELKIALSFIDSGGHRTNEVYTMAARSSRMMAIKGVASTKDKQDPLIRKLSKVSLNGNVKGKTHLLVLGVNAGKDALFDMEVRTITGDRCLHYWAGGGYDKTYFSGLLSEKKVGGKWIAPQRGSTPNEPLDCRVYAMAAAEYYLTKIIPRGLDPDYRRRNMAKKVSKKAEKEQEQIVIEEQKPYNGEDHEVEVSKEPKPVDNSASKYEQF